MSKTEKIKNYLEENRSAIKLALATLPSNCNEQILILSQVINVIYDIIEKDEPDKSQ